MKRPVVSGKLLANILICFGIICFIILFHMLLLRVFPVPKQRNIPPAIKKTPIQIIIKDIAIDLPIIPAISTKGIFQTTTQGVSYLASSPLPGNKGNSILYAHNWWNLFGALPKVKQGEKIQILFSDKTKKTFTITATQIVSPRQTSLLANTNDSRLTLFTCANFLDADRFVVIAQADK